MVDTIHLRQVDLAILYEFLKIEKSNYISEENHRPPPFLFIHMHNNVIAFFSPIITGTASMQEFLNCPLITVT